MQKSQTKNKQTQTHSADTATAGRVFDFSFAKLPLVTKEDQQKIREAAKQPRPYGRYPEIILPESK
jgi:hypothetical protein